MLRPPIRKAGLYLIRDPRIIRITQFLYFMRTKRAIFHGREAGGRQGGYMEV